MEKQVLKLISPFAPNGIDCKGQKDFDQDYKDISIVDKVFKTGDGDQDFVVGQDVIVTLKPIKEVVDADKQSVGVVNIMKQFMRTGDQSLLPMDDGKHSADYVGAPQSLMELHQLGEKAKKDFDKLPPELVKKMDMKSFVENMDQEQFNAFVKAVADRSSKKKEEVKKDGE